MKNQLKTLLINNSEMDVAARDIYDVLVFNEEKEVEVEVEGDGRGNTSSFVLEGYDTVTVKPYDCNTINSIKYAQLSKDMGIPHQLELWAGENQFLPLLPREFEDLDGIVVSMDQNNRFSARLVRTGRDYPYQLLRYWCPFLEVLWVRERIDYILGAPGERLLFQPSNSDPVPCQGV